MRPHGPISAALAASFLAILALAPALAEAGAESAAQTEAETAPVVTTTVVKTRAVEDWRRAVGVLEATETPTVAAEVAGRIEAIFVDEGDAVKKGRVLARIEAKDYRLAVEQARARIRRAQAQLRGARLRLERLRRLVAKGTAPQSALDDARSAHDAIAAEVAAAKVALAIAERRLRKTVITSPVTGRVQKRFVSQGDFIAAGRPAFALLDTQHLRARLPFAETLAPRLKPGLPVRLFSPAAPGARLRATVRAVLPAIDPAAHALTLLVDVPASPGLRPGASISAEVMIARRENAVVVPAQAVVLRPRGHVVYVLAGERVRARSVEPGLRLGREVEIRRGLRAGERIVVDGAGFLRDGIRVKARALEPQS